MLITVLGKRWRYTRPLLAGADGFCDAPTVRGKTISVDCRLRGERELEIIIHELLHAAAWQLDEQLVSKFAEDTARILTKLGYRGA